MNAIPDRPVRWGILGTARIAQKLAAAMHQAPNAEVVAVASREASRAADWAGRHQVPVACASYEELLERDDIDAVYIPLPPTLHAEWTIRAAERGKHILCEKPLAASLREALEMEAACRANDVQLMDGVMWLHTPRATAMADAVARGSLGDLRRTTAAFSFCWDPPPLEDIRFRSDVGGGALGDTGWYCVGVALWAFGATPVRAFGTARWGHGVDVHFSGTLWFDDGRMASFDCGFDTVTRRWFEIAGTHGSLVCDDFVRPWAEKPPRFWTHDRNGVATTTTCEDHLQEMCLVEAFGRIVQSGVRDEHWPRRAIETQRVCGALMRSARCGETVEC